MSNINTMKKLYIVFLIIAVVMSGVFFKFIGNDTSREYVNSFSNYLKKEGIDELTYNEKTGYLEVKRHNIKVFINKKFNYINSIKLKDDLVYIDLKESFLDQLYNDMTYGSLLKEDIASIMVIFNKIEEVEINNKEKIESYYTKFYPYNVSFCDFDFSISLFDKELKCPVENNVGLKINSKDNTYELVIDNYPTWETIFPNYISFSEQKVIDKIKEFTNDSKVYNDKKFIENSYIESIKDKDNIIMTNGTIRKTKRNITSEVLVVRTKNTDYIEDIDDEVVSFISYKDVDSFNEDIRYIKENMEQ